MDQNQLRRSIDCRDAGGRRAVVGVYAEPGGVFMRAPAGEVARLDPNGIEALKRALTDAMVHSARSM